MIFTFLFRLCTMIGICQFQDLKKTHFPVLNDLNSFSSKTAYRNSRLKPLKESSNHLSGCSLVQMNTVFRHGTRFPSAADMDKIEIAFKKIMRSHAQSILPPELKNWKLPFPRNREKELASVGYEEMMLLGNRFREKISGIITDSNVLKFTKFYSSGSARAKLSAATFMRLFFNETKTMKDVLKIINENDQYLRFFDNCPYYLTSVLRDKASKLEYIKYLNGPEIRRLIKEIQQKWKLTDVNLNPDDVRALYIMCGYEIATNLSSFMRPHECPVSPAGDGLVVCPLHHKFAAMETSPLCSLLESEQYTVLEYLYDLKHYWLRGYGKEINWLQGCALMSPLLQQIMSAARAHQSALKAMKTSQMPFQSHLDRQEYYRGTFWFGHAETILPLVALLGLFNQTIPMDANSFQKRLSIIGDADQRFSIFRTSNIIPFSGNLALELHHCPHLAQADLSGYRVQVKVNEKTVAWPIANGHSHISLELLMKHLKMCLSDQYDHNAVCVQGMTAAQLLQAQKRSDEL